MMRSPALIICKHQQSYRTKEERGWYLDVVQLSFGHGLEVRYLGVHTVDIVLDGVAWVPTGVLYRQHLLIVHCRGDIHQGAESSQLERSPR